jgi:hypothetical protein
MANAETFAMNAEAFLANAEAFAATLTCSPGQRGNPASCALSMILNLDWTDTLARRRGFFRALMAGRAGRRCLRMSLKGVSRSAKAPWRQANWPQAARLWVPLDPIVEAGEPAARTRQIQIRNRQQHLHTARGGEWQASVRPGPGASRASSTERATFARPATGPSLPAGCSDMFSDFGFVLPN